MVGARQQVSSRIRATSRSVPPATRPPRADLSRPPRDELPLLALAEQALPLTWTRDPFDRLLVAHSNARRTPLCTVDRDIRRRHALLPPELRHPS